MAVTSVECGDFLQFQEMLQKMRLLDDKIIYMLNTSLPTESFKGQVNATSKCQELFQEIQNGHIQREKAINKCLITAKEKVKHLKHQRESERDDLVLLKRLRKEQTTLRLLESELGVEEVVRNRTMQAYYEKCRGYYKPSNLNL